MKFWFQILQCALSANHNCPIFNPQPWKTSNSQYESVFSQQSYIITITKFVLFLGCASAPQPHSPMFSVVAIVVVVLLSPIQSKVGIEAIEAIVIYCAAYGAERLFSLVLSSFNDIIQLNLHETDLLFQYLSHHLTQYCLLIFGFPRYCLLRS